MSYDSLFKHMQKALEKDEYGSVHRAGDITISSTIPYGILSGIPRLDYVIGRPGLPVGKVIEFFGLPGVGKTTAALHVLAQAQQAGGGGYFIDAEASWDENRATEIGVDVNKNFFVGNADSVEAIFRQIDEILEWRIKEDNFDEPCVVVVDSVTGKGNETELDRKKKIGQELKVGEDARVIRGCMRQVVSRIAKTKTLVLFVNHAIAKIGAGPYQKQSDSSGGYAIKFYSSLRCSFVNAGLMTTGDKDNKRKEGQKVNIRVEKLKNSRLEILEVKEASLMGENGIDLSAELFEAGKFSGMLSKVNNQCYKFEEQEFYREDWDRIVHSKGGPQGMYNHFIEWCIANDKMTHWGEKLYG